MVCEDTLRIRNLPKELSDTEIEDLLCHFGAAKVKTITSKAQQKSVAYAKFDSKEIAKSVMFRLHQMTILTSRLCVEYAQHDVAQGRSNREHLQPEDANKKKHFKSFISKLNSWNSAVSFHQPPPAHLKYVYPKTNRATINNIAHALICVPKFYTQVLHLMNKMNLPPPFSDVPDPPQVSLRQLQVQPSAIAVGHLPTPQKETPVESSESELESDPEICDKTKDIIPQKRTLPQRKMVKRPKFIRPIIATPSSNIRAVDRTEDVFEKVDIQPHSKIELKVSAESLQTKLQQIHNKEQESVGEIGLMVPIQNKCTSVIQEMQEEVVEMGVITEDELSSNRIPVKDFNVLPVFKDYHPGIPTCRLYIKNLAKTVEEKDLEFIYKRYKENAIDENKISQFDIRLMKEGRMKGQAFITLDNVQLAQRALKETNGYILKDKPLVVVFARSAAPKK